jgi:ParB family chromosome partitioning protein
MERKSIIDPVSFKVDDFFTTQKERDEARKEKVEELNISDLVDFKNHPFKVVNNDDLKKLEESIKVNGILEPIIVRKKDDHYEIISGHRRKLASEIIGLKSIPCIIRDMSDDDAVIYMVDSNMHRESILPSEKAKAYKMKLDAINHQGRTLSQVATKSDSAKEIGEENGESRDQVFRYVRLNNLIPELLDKVDSKEIAFNPAVEISYLKKSEQEMLLDAMNYCEATPSHAQTIILKKLSQENNLTNDTIVEMMNQEKPNQKTKIKISEDKIKNIIPSNLKIDNYEEFIIKAVDYYSKHLERYNEKER